jgi:hypothetical protein
MIFTPSLPIVVSLGAAFVLPAILVALSHGPWKVSAPGRRFVLAAVAALSGWGLSLFAVSPLALADLVAGALILLAALLAGFTVWTLIAWGFTASLLMSLAREDRPVSLDEWVAAYTGDRTIETFARDRVQLLFRFDLATAEADRIVMTPGAGLRMARFARFLRVLVGLPT